MSLAESHSLPTPRTSLVGRLEEIAATRKLLVDSAVAVLALTNPAGVGKTRLAIAIAATFASLLADGAAFIDLSPLDDPSLVLSTIAQWLGITEVRDRSPSSRQR